MTFLANKQKGRPKRPPFLFALLLSLFLIQPASNHTADDTTEDGHQASQSEASASGPPKIAVAVERGVLSGGIKPPKTLVTM